MLVRPERMAPRSTRGVRPSCTSTLARPRSASNSRTRRPARVNAWDNVIASQVFPTPPLPEAIAMNRGRSGGIVCSLEAGQPRGEERRGERDQAIGGARADAGLGQRQAAGGGGRDDAAKPVGEIEAGNDQ